MPALHQKKCIALLTENLHSKLPRTTGLHISYQQLSQHLVSNVQVFTEEPRQWTNKTVLFVKDFAAQDHHSSESDIP